MTSYVSKNRAGQRYAAAPRDEPLSSTTDGLQGSTDCRGGEKYLEFVPQEHHHHIEVLVGVFKKMLAQSVDHWWTNGSRRSRAGVGCIGASEAAEVSPDGCNSTNATSRHLSHLGGS